ncbi:MAG TPA: hypothetical protein V6D08_20695 [Candidatus Obscuribacterales bacterium]
MGPADIPEPEKQAEHRQTDSARESHTDFMGELMTLLKAGKDSTDKGKSGTRIENHGQIEAMAFPDGWVAGKPQANPGIGTRSYREVYRKDHPDTAVSFFYRGLPVSNEAALSFRDVLSKAPHELTEQEKKSLADVLSTKTPVASDQFAMSSCRTEDLNGKKVLVVEGQYTQSGDKIHAVYVDADGSGRFVQEIFYQSAKDQYDTYWKGAQSAFKSIDWK